jgi:hypothetical protein
MQSSGNAILYTYFQDLTDSRMEGRISHKLIDIVIIAISAVLSGAESWTAIERFGQTIDLLQKSCKLRIVNNSNQVESQTKAFSSITIAFT